MDFIRVYDKKMQPIAEIDEFSSCSFTKKFYEVGEWELHLPYRDDLHEILRNGMYFLVNNDAKKAGLVENIDIPYNDEVVLSGTTLSGVFSRRIIIPPDGENYVRIDNSTIEDIMYGFVNGQCINPADIRRKFKYLNMAASQNRGIVTNWRASYPQYLNEILYDVGVYGDMGYDVYLDIPNKKWVFEVISGRKLTTTQNVYPPVIFSSELDNLKEVNYINDKMEYKNSVYAFRGDLEMNDFNVYISRDEGLFDFELREVYYDASGEAEDMTELQKAAERHKKEMVVIETLQGDVIDTTSFKYGQDWFLGDIVTIVHNKAGKVLEERITSITEVIENTNQKIVVAFGIDKKDPLKKITDLERKVR